MPLNLSFLQEFLQLSRSLILRSSSILINKIAHIDGFHGFRVQGHEERGDSETDDTDEDVGEGCVRDFRAPGIGVFEDYVADEDGQGCYAYTDQHRE